MTEPNEQLARRAVERLPSVLFVMTSGFEGDRAGTLVRWVSPAAEDPPLVSVAVPKGHAIEPLIRDSRAFALCAIDPEDKRLRGAFAATCAPDERGDPFDSFGVRTLTTGSPVLGRSTFVLDCEVVRHFDLEADHEFYVGLVVNAIVPAD